MVQRRPRAHAGATIKATRVGRGNSNLVNAGRRSSSPGGRPSLEFDWDTALARVDKILAEREKDDQ